MVRYAIKHKLNVIILSLIGSLTSQEVAEKVQTLKIKERVHPGMNIAIDTREQINVFTRDEILKIFFELVGVEKKPLINKAAIITVSDEELGTGKIYSVYKHKSKIEAVVFSDIDNAHKWLEIPKGIKLF